MTLDPANNLAETELTASVSDTATTLPVADASVFPDADTEGAFNVLVWDADANINPSEAPDAEFVRVTSVDTTADELTVDRGQENTAPSAKAVGSTVTDTWSVKDRDDIDAGIAAKADDPHGSESHSSDVVHEGEDAAFGDTTHDSVSTGGASITEQFSLDRSNNNPHPIRSFEQSGPMHVAPFPEVENPIITEDDVNAEDFVADPFWVVDDGDIYLFVEELTVEPYQKDIGVFRSEGADIQDWDYLGIALSAEDAGEDMSYPWVRKIDGTWYMTPERSDRELHIWTTDDESFPFGWEEGGPADVLSAWDFTDATPVYLPQQTRWYIIDEEQIIYADEGRDLVGRNWTEHPDHDGRPYPRPGGRPIVYDNGHVDIWYQDGDSNYGDKIRGYRITELTTDSYQAVEMTTNPIIEGTDIDGDWNQRGMHHIDPLMSYIGGPPLVLVDGHYRDDGQSRWQIGIYTVSDGPETGEYHVNAKSGQTLENDVVETISWETFAGDVPVPAQASQVKIYARFRMDSLATVDFFDTEKNGEGFETQIRDFEDGGIETRSHTAVSGWTSVDEGDTLSVRVRQSSGDDVGLDASGTVLQVEYR